MMTAFTKENFYINGEYVDYNHSQMSKFVGRFKYAAKTSKSSFITFLIKNFTVEEYFSRMEDGESPLAILQSKGYLLSHVKKLLKTAGYPATVAGLEKYILNMGSNR
jgi:hypothetical protein